MTKEYDQEYLVRRYSRSDLHMAALRAGIKAFDHKSIRRREIRGVFECARSPVTGWRVFSQKDIDEIIREFSPGGSGSWKYTIESNEN